MQKSIGRLITTLSRTIQQELKEVIEPFGITVGEEPYFTELAHEEGITQDDLTNRVNVDKAATARMVKSLEQKGFLARVVDKDDRRSKRLFLTEKGREVYKEMVEALRQYNHKLTLSWSEKEYGNIYHSLEALYEECKKRISDELIN